jgi:uncharacterized protein with NAD-binding domain and iron-sulfur cluster
MKRSKRAFGMRPPISAAASAFTGPSRVVIVGGGLAGMMVAKCLAERGRRVILLEKGSHLGGKAGAKANGPFMEDHGYHVFPKWYVNARALLDELGVTAHLRDVSRFHTLRRGEFPKLVTQGELSPLSLIQSLFGGVLPWHDNLLSYFNVLELACEPFERRAYLDRISASGFLRARYYATEQVARYHQQTMLQAVSIPNYEVSAMTLQKLVRAWLGRPSPLYSILDGNLLDTFITPFADRLIDLGVAIHTGVEIEELAMVGDRIGGVVAGGSDQRAIERELTLTENDVYVLATPYARTLEILTTGEQVADDRSRIPFDDAEPFGLLGMAHLRSAPMAALHLHLRWRIDHMPAEHINLLDSRFGLTVVDVSQHWGELGSIDGGNTTLFAVAANFEPLQQLSEPAARRMLEDELLEYFPVIRAADLRSAPDEEFERSYLQTHKTEPLFLNTVGAWQFRPGTQTGIPNLFVAGDFCRTEVDLTCMESAIMSGMSTAAAILELLGESSLGVGPQPLDLVPLPLLHALRLALTPVVAPLGMVKWAQRRLDELVRQQW